MGFSGLGWALLGYLAGLSVGFSGVGGVLQAQDIGRTLGEEARSLVDLKSNKPTPRVGHNHNSQLIAVNLPHSC